MTPRALVLVLLLAPLGAQDEALRTRLDRSRGDAEALTRIASETEDPAGKGLAYRMLADALAGSDRYHEATAALRHAADQFELAHDAGAQAEALTTLGSTASFLGDHADAQACLDRAIALAEQIDDEHLLARGHEERALLSSSSGNYGAAVRDLQAALTTWQAIGDHAQEGRALVRLGGLYSEVGAFADAEDALLRAGRLFAGEPATEGRALAALGLLRLDMGRADAALELLDLGLERARSSHDSAGIGNAQRQRGRALAALGRWRDAEVALHEALAWSERVGDRFGTALDLTDLAAALLSQGRDDDASATIERALTIGTGLANPEATWRAHALRGRALLRDDAPGALTEFRTAIAEVERLHELTAAPTLRRQFLDAKLDLFRDTAALLVAQGDDAAAFALGERTRSRALADLMAFAPVIDGDRLAALRAAERELVALERRGTAGEDVGPALQAARVRRDRVRIDLELATPRAAALAGFGEPATTDALGARLAADTALCAYLTGPETTLLWVVRRDATTAFELPISRDRLTALVDGILDPIDDLVAGRVDVANLRFDTRAAHELWGSLLAPASDALRGAERLVFAPDGPLRRLPFAALVVARQARPVDPDVLFAQYHGCRFLIEDHIVQTLPVARLLLHDAPAPTRPPLGLAAPSPLPDAAAALPASVDELAALRTAFRDGRWLVGAQATEAALRRDGPGAALVHIAAHTMLDEARPAYSRTALAPEGNDDGWLHAYEIEQLDLAGAWVVLSGCQSAGTTECGEGLAGITRACLIAGSAGVTATRWPVDDRASAALITETYRAHAAGHDPAAALRWAAVRMLRDARATGSPWFHPFFWAGFAHFGAP